MKYGVKYDVPSTFETILYFYMNIFIFGALAWYFDHVDSSNRGKTYGYLFFLKKSYWCGRKGSKANASNLHYYERIYNEIIDDKKSFDKIIESNVEKSGKRKFHL